MLFSSYAFLFLFLPGFLVAWQLAFSICKNPLHAQTLVLLVSSLVFYGFWGLPFLGLLLAMVCINYGFGTLLHDYANSSEAGRESPRKAILATAIVVNLLPLLWFKYSFFIIRNISLLFATSWRFEPPELPLGISFYTFIQIAWLVGVYRGQFAPAGITRHAVFSTCFPYVISGPIMRYDQTGWQLDRLSGLTSAGMAKGVALFSMGLAKKAILADSIGLYSDAVFNAAQKGWPISSLEAWLGSFCYTFQLYFDFSGYTDMALGLGLMIGLRFPENFNSPYKSTGIIDFWRRWHITLSSWLRDFLYIPLGGNRRGRARQYGNLFLTMLIGGAWHGAGWTYVIWGALHGIMLAVNHFYRSLTKNSRVESVAQLPPLRIIAILFTFFCLNFCWVVFRAPSLDAAMSMYAAMFIAPLGEPGATLMPNNYFNGWQPFFLLGICAIICWLFPNSRQIIHGDAETSRNWAVWRPSAGWAVSLALLTFVSLTLLSRQASFLYFQF